jgi:hypothetical protein
MSQNTKAPFMAMLPLELWIMIFDMVIEEGIIRLDQCDYNTFPRDHMFLSPVPTRDRFYGSYCRLRLVCRSFNALLGTRPQCKLGISYFPFPMRVRALHVGDPGLPNAPVFRQLLEDASRCERLVFLNITCSITTEFGETNLPDLFSAGEAGAFPNVNRLTLWILTEHPSEGEISFWTHLHRGFAELVTLSVDTNYGFLYLKGEPDSVTTFGRLETLYVGLGVSWSGCHFPRLRHASAPTLSVSSVPETFRRSPHLECLLITSRYSELSVDVGSFPRLRVLSVHEYQLQKVVALDCDHPLEHLWLHLGDRSKNPGLIEEIVKRIPRIIRITLNLSFVTPNRRTERIQELKSMRLDLFGPALKPVELNSRLLFIEQSVTIPKDGI